LKKTIGSSKHRDILRIEINGPCRHGDTHLTSLVIATLRFSFAENRVNKRHGDFSSTLQSLADSAQTKWRGGANQMERPSELFLIGAVMLLGFALVERFISPSTLGFSISWHGTGYVFPPASISVAQATALYFFATIYSLWMLPFNRTAMLWHFWLTIAGITVFWLSFYRAASTLPDWRAAVWAAFISPAVVLLTQVLFVWNLVQAIFKMPRLHS
jgi:hypothetical protein